MICNYNTFEEGKYKGIEIKKHIMISNNGIVKNKFYSANDDRTGFNCTTNKYNELIEKIDKMKG